MPTFRLETCDVASLRSAELQELVQKLQTSGEEHEIARAFVPDFPNPIAVVFLPATRRAGVTWGGAVDWTDASSISDAIERYFGLHGKQLERPRE